MRGTLLGFTALAGLAIASSAMATGTYSNGFANAVAIPDSPGAPATLDLVVPAGEPGGEVITSINVGINIRHTWQGDLVVTLTHVGSGNNRVLLSRPGAVSNPPFGCSADNYGNFTTSTRMFFKDSGATVYDTPFVVFPGTTDPVGDWKAVGGTMAAAFNGLGAAGTWRLSVQDLGAGDVGTIDGFELNIVTTDVPAPGSLALLGLGGLAAARRRRRVAAVTAAAAGLALGAPAMAQFGTGPAEVEPNDTKALADTNEGTWSLPSALGTTAGVITGTSASSTGVGVDYFHLRTAVQGGLAIYRNRLIIGSTPHSATIRGWSGQTGTTEATIQSSLGSTFTPARFNQWYSYGRASDLYYRVTGTTSTTTYSIAYDLAVVTPKPAGSFLAGPITLTTVGQTTTDTELFLYNSSFTQIGQNDDQFTGGGLQSRIDITLAVGTYYLAIGNSTTSQSNLANGAAANGGNTAFNDAFLGGNRMEFVDGLLRNSTTAFLAGPGGAALNISITDGVTPVATPGDAQAALDMQWYTFTVKPVPAPGAMALLGLGGLLVARRRRS